MADLGLRETSKAFLGNMYRLETLAVIRSFGHRPFSAKMVHRLLQSKREIEYGRVRDVIAQFAEDGALERIGKGDRGQIMYRRVDNPAWALLRRLASDLGE